MDTTVGPGDGAVETLAAFDGSWEGVDVGAAVGSYVNDGADVGSTVGADVLGLNDGP